jgi:pilus assembly protein CpaF
MAEKILSDALASWLDDPDVSEIMVNGYDHVYLEREANLVRVPSPFRDDEQVMEVIRAISAPLGRTVDERTPMVDARLPDGSRVSVVIPPVSILGPALVIRKFRQEAFTAQDLIRFHTWSEDVVAFLRACVRARLNIVVAGGTGAGKSTVLNVLANMIPDGERIVTVENAGELRLHQKRVVPLESRPPNSEGKGEVTIREMVVNACHMRPDRIVVGEVRWTEASDVVRAMNTGHDGSMLSIHAGDVRDVLFRLETLVTSANPSVPLLNVRREISTAIDLIVYQRRMHDGSRKVIHVTQVLGMEGDAIRLEDIFVYRQTGVPGEGAPAGYHTATGVIPACIGRIRDAGLDLPVSMFTPR